MLGDDDDDDDDDDDTMANAYNINCNQHLIV